MKILLADDHPIFRKGLKSLIADHFQDFRIDEADNGTEAIAQLKIEEYIVTILDIDMPEKSGIDVLKEIAKQGFKTKPIVLTMHNDELFFNESFNHGSCGFLLKEDSSKEIIDCINSIIEGIPYVSKRIEPFLANRKQFNSRMFELKQAIDSLSAAERNTLTLVSKNKTSREIAELLFVTEKSVENYRSRICRKLNVKGGSNTLYKWCIENKDLIDPIS
jgi:DNA-binding NarL/FixJ family response regulator